MDKRRLPMSIEAWLTKDGKKAIEVMGWPKWESGIGHTVLNSVWSEWSEAWKWKAQSPLHPVCEITLCNHTALCLLRDWARTFLNGYGITIWGPGSYTDEGIGPEEGGVWSMAGGGAPGTDDRWYVTGADYDSLLVNAVLATKGRGGGRCSR